MHAKKCANKVEMIHESPIPTSLSLAGRNSAWTSYCKRRIHTRLGHSVCRTRVLTPRTLHLEVATVVYCTHIAFVGPHYTQWHLSVFILTGGFLGPLSAHRSLELCFYTAHCTIHLWVWVENIFIGYEYFFKQWIHSNQLMNGSVEHS